MGKFTQRVGEKATAAGRVGLKVGAVAGAGALAYLGYKHDLANKAKKGGEDALGAADLTRQEAEEAMEQAKKAKERIQQAGEAAEAAKEEGRLKRYAHKYNQAQVAAEEALKAKNKAEAVRQQGIIAAELAKARQADPKGTHPSVQAIADNKRQVAAAEKVGKKKAKHTYGAKKQQMNPDRMACMEFAGAKRNPGKRKFKLCSEAFLKKYGKPIV